jgi:hypothetical protein
MKMIIGVFVVSLVFVSCKTRTESNLAGGGGGRQGCKDSAEELRKRKVGEGEFTLKRLMFGDAEMRGAAKYTLLLAEVARQLGLPVEDIVAKVEVGDLAPDKTMGEIDQKVAMVRTIEVDGKSFVLARVIADAAMSLEPAARAEALTELLKAHMDGSSHAEAFFDERLRGVFLDTLSLAQELEKRNPGDIGTKLLVDMFKLEALSVADPKSNSPEKMALMNRINVTADAVGGELGNTARTIVIGAAASASAFGQCESACKVTYQKAAGGGYTSALTAQTAGTFRETGEVRGAAVDQFARVEAQELRNITDTALRVQEGQSARVEELGNRLVAAKGVSEAAKMASRRALQQGKRNAGFKK